MDFKQTDQDFSPFSSKSILYVEDEQEIREILEEYLQKYFDCIYLAADGIEGLEIYKEHQPDIVFTDLIMPKMNGLDMIREIQKINPDCHVMILSAHNDNKYLSAAIEAGVEHFAFKPVDYKKMYTNLYKMCRSIDREQLLENYRKQLEFDKAFLQSVLNSQKNMLVILRDGIVSDINETFARTFPQFNSIHSFNQAYPTLNRIFEPMDEPDYIGPNDPMWLDKLLDPEGPIYKVLVKQGSHDRVYEIYARKLPKSTTESILVIFQDITCLEEQKIELNLKNIELEKMVRILEQKNHQEEVYVNHLFSQESQDSSIMDTMVGFHTSGSLDKSHHNHVNDLFTDIEQRILNAEQQLAQYGKAEQPELYQVSVILGDFATLLETYHEYSPLKSKLIHLSERLIRQERLSLYEQRESFIALESLLLNLRKWREESVHRPDPSYKKLHANSIANDINIFIRYLDTL